MSIYLADNAYGINMRTGDNTGASTSVRMAITVWIFSLAVLSLYVFSFPAWIDSDTTNFALYYKILLSGKPLSMEAYTIPQLIPVLMDGAIWRITSSIRALQVTSILAFATAVTCIFIALSRTFGKLAASLSLAGVLSSAPTLTTVSQGRSPTWAILFLALALVYFTVGPVSEKRLHITLFLSLAATLCRSDLVALHLALVFMAVLYAAGNRSWLTAFRLGLWGFGALTSVATDTLFTHNPFFTRESSLFFITTRQAFKDLLSGPNAATAVHPSRLTSTLSLLHKGMNSPGNLFAYTYGLLIIPAFIAFFRKSPKMTAATLMITGGIAAPTLILSFNNFYAARSFFPVRLLFILFSAIGAAAILQLIFRNARRRNSITAVFVTALLLAHIPAYRTHLTQRNARANEFRQHDELAQTLAKTPQQFPFPVLVEPAYLGYIYMLRLNRSHNEIINKYDFARKTYAYGESIPALIWIGKDSPQTALPTLKIIRENCILTHDSINVTELQLAE